MHEIKIQTVPGLTTTLPYYSCLFNRTFSWPRENACMLNLENNRDFIWLKIFFNFIVWENWDLERWINLYKDTISLINDRPRTYRSNVIFLKREEKLLQILLTFMPHSSLLFATLTTLHKHFSMQNVLLLFMKSCAVMGKPFDLSVFNSNKGLGLYDM